MEKILDFYQEAATYQVQPKNHLSDWEIQICQEDCLNHEDFIRFEKFLLSTNADLVKVPVIYQADKIPVIARWETAAVRRDCWDGMVETCFCPVYPSNQFQLYNMKGYQSFLLKQFEQALEEFTELQNKGDEKEQAVFGRWVILTLMRLQRKEEAKRRLKELMDQHPYNADLYKLNQLLEGQQKDAYPINILGDAANYPEFFYKVDSEGIKGVNR